MRGVHGYNLAMTKNTPLHTYIEQQAQRLEQAHVQFGQGTLSAFDEAAWLTLWQLGLPLDSDIDAADSPALTAEQMAAVEQLITKRIDTRKPAAYLTQEAWLQGVPFYVDERVIIPRSLIAEPLADGSLDIFLHPNTQQVLDLCTGNGSLAVLCAMAWPEVQVTAADISPDALAVAQINVAKHGLTDRIRLIQSDGLSQCHGVYDLIVCNPPYVNADSMAHLPAEFQAEPTLALAGGNDGMDFIRPMLQQVVSRLSQHGVLVLEIGHERAYFEAAFPTLNPVWLDTSAGSDQVLLLTYQDLQNWAKKESA